MISHYIVTAWRNLKKRKVFTLINLFGLATGMAVCLLLALYVESQLGYDRFQENAGRIYRLALERSYPGRTSYMGEVPQSIGQAVKREMPEVLESVRILRAGRKVKIGNTLFENETIFGADSNFFRVFTGTFIQGSKGDVLRKPNTAVVNESTAIRFFGSAQNAMGKHLLVNGSDDCLIDGVCKDWPGKSHFKFSVLLPTTGFNLNDPNYYDFAAYTYLLLNANASPLAVEKKLPLIVAKYVAPTIQKGFGETFEQFTKAGNKYRYFLQPIEKIHLYSDLQDEIIPTTSINIIYLAAAIGVFILLLASINFINLSTAISVERAKEIGLRKTLGANKGSIVWQFLWESVLFSLLSVNFSFLLAGPGLRVMNRLTGTELGLSSFLNPVSVAAILGLSLLIGAAAGLYPAFVLSSFKPTSVLKGRFKSGKAGTALRNSLIVFQFSISLILLVCTMVVNRQMQLLLGDKLGFSKSNIIAISDLYHLQNDRQYFETEVSKINGIMDQSICSDLPQGAPYASCAMEAVENRSQRTDRTAYVDERYQRVLGLQLVSGRFFSKDLATDSTSFVLNEAAVKDFGLTQPIGAHITSTELNFNPPGSKQQTVYTVIGVVKDYHFESLHQQIAPLILANANKFGASTLAIKIKGKDLASAIPAIERIWKRVQPESNFKYSFLDDIVGDQYKSEQTAQLIFKIFSTLSILIGCIGLFGLVMYATFQRTKEISVRKVLGATAADVLGILLKDFMMLVAIAVILAIPVAWWAMNFWLQSFAYRINIGWEGIALSVVLIMAIAFTTISFHAIKVAVANPIKSLRAD